MRLSGAPASGYLHFWGFGQGVGVFFDVQGGCGDQALERDFCSTWKSRIAMALQLLGIGKERSNVYLRRL